MKSKILAIFAIVICAAFLLGSSALGPFRATRFTAYDNGYFEMLEARAIGGTDFVRLQLPADVTTSYSITHPAAAFSGIPKWTNSSNVITVAQGSILPTAATLDFSSTSAQTCSALTATVTGSSDGDPCSLGVPNVSNVGNGNFSCFVSAANTVTVKFCNPSAGALDPASGSFKITVFK